jgi:hypothetical protein
MDLLEKKANGMTMIDVMDKTNIRRWIDGFVDDTSLFINIDFISQCAQTMSTFLEEDGCRWAGLLEASGGKLELMKCFYYILTWSWNEKGEAIPQTINQQAVNKPVQIRSKDYPPIQLQQREVGTSHKTMGTHKCLDGDETEHIKTLEKKSTNLGNLVFTGQLNRRQARLAHNMIYIPSMAYSLPAMTLSEEKTLHIQQRASTKFLQVCGLAQSYPRAVVYGPEAFGWMGMKYLYSECSCQKIDSLINQFKTDSSLAHEMRLNLNWLQITAGTSTSLC